METNNITVLIKKDHIALRIKDAANYDDIIKELKEKLPDLKKFYKDEKTPILVTGKILKIDDIDSIQKLIQKSLEVEVDFDSPRTMGLTGIRKTFNKDIDSSETRFYNGSLRSGNKVEFEGSVVIIGDVNDGAEVVAEDNIVVTGRLRGMCHAGAKGNKKAIIAAHLIDSVQVRIADIIKERTKEEIETEANTIAYVDDNEQIVLE